jgi:hypothetical protein
MRNPILLEEMIVMSDYTFGQVTSYNGHGAPAVQVNRALGSAAQVGYGFILDELAALTRPVNYEFLSSPAAQHAQTRIISHASRLTTTPSAAVNATTPTITAAGTTYLRSAETIRPMFGRSATATTSTSSPTASDTTTKATAPTLSMTSLTAATMHQSPTPITFSTPPSMASAPPIVRQSFSLLARAEVAVALAENAFPSLSQAPSTLQMVRQKVAAATIAIDKGNAQGALEASQVAAEAAAALEEELRQSLATRTAQARHSADALARSGALWTALHSHKPLLLWASKNATKQMKASEEALRKSRKMHIDGRFKDSSTLSQELEKDISALLENARSYVARQQRDAYANEAGNTLRSLGFETESKVLNDQRVVTAVRNANELLTVTFDNEGKFAIDSRHGFEGAPSCSVEVNKFLKALSEKMKIKVEKHIFAGHPDHAPGHVALQNTGRRRIAISEVLDQTATNANRAPVPPQAAIAAWTRITR